MKGIIIKTERIKHPKGDFTIVTCQLDDGRIVSVCVNEEGWQLPDEIEIEEFQYSLGKYYRKSVD